MVNLSRYKLSNYDYFVFDLDNTLYEEVDYLFAAYSEIAHFLSTDKIGYNDIYTFLTENFLRIGRNNLLNNLLEKFKIPLNEISNCLEILRNTQVKIPINLYPEMYELLCSLNKLEKQLFILTNGNVIQQKNKIKNINWGVLTKSIIPIYSNEFKPKPSNLSLEFIIKKYKLDRSRILYIGDSYVDIECARRSNIEFVLKKHKI